MQYSLNPLSHQSYSSSTIIYTQSNELYKEYFEKQFLVETEKFYLQESQYIILESSLSEYLSILEKRYREENERVISYLDHSTENQLLSSFFRVFLGSQSKTLLELKSSGLSYQIQNENYQNLAKSIFYFSKDKESFDLFRKYFSIYIIDNINEIMKKNLNRNSLIKMIDDFNVFKQKIQFIFQNCFSESDYDKENFKIMKKVVKDSFEEVFIKILKK